MIGSIAAILTTFAFLPQVVRVVKTKDTESIALGMYVIAGHWHRFVACPLEFILETYL